MRTEPTLILDLDDTIFPTRSIPADVFEGLFRSLDSVDHPYSPQQMETIREELWKHAFHDVADRYQFPAHMKSFYLAQLDALPLSFDIRVYPDYPQVLSLGLPMVLVTSGTTKVQQTKIDSLNIRDHYCEIHIDDRNIRSGGKRRIFSELLERHAKPPDSFLVIGDNPLSEIRAAGELSIPWLQVDRSMPESAGPVGRRIPSLAYVDEFI